MISAQECFQRAIECEDRAKACRNDVDRYLLLSTGSYWRSLGEVAQRLERQARPADPTPREKPDD